MGCALHADRVALQRCRSLGENSAPLWSAGCSAWQAVASAFVPGPEDVVFAALGARAASRAPTVVRHLDEGGAAGDNVGMALRAEARMTRWGWSGSAKYQSALDAVDGAGSRATLGADELGGILPTRQEAERMIADTGGRVVRVERGHTSGRGHATPHINYETSSGNRATILVENVGRQYRAPRQ